MSAVAMGYMADPYAQTFFPPGEPIAKRYPIINRGTYVRTAAIDRFVIQFLDAAPGERKQIVSLGAGSDTRFFRLCAGRPGLVYHELDFEANVARKRTAIRDSTKLSRMTLPSDDGAARYFLHAVDLRDLTKRSPPALPGLELQMPTLILSECCLCYLAPELAESVLQYFTMNLTAAGGVALVLYEPVRPTDAFGRTMVANLASRGIHLQTLQRYHSLAAQRERLRLAGLTTGQGARDVLQLWRADDWVPAAERERIDRLEWLDEVEEWNLLARHYCVAWGWRGDVFSTAWADVQGGVTQDERGDDRHV